MICCTTFRVDRDGFQDKCKEIQECEVLHFRGLTKAIRVEALNKAIECLQAYCAAEEDE
jgi:hypothetical protein